MNCEWAEEHLSAFLDNALDSQSQRDVEAHLAGCARCQAMLEDFRRNDRLIAALPRIEPSDALRARIFDSPEYRALLDDLRREAEAGEFAGAPSLAAYGAYRPDAADPAAAAGAPSRTERDASPRSGPRSGAVGQRRGTLRRWARIGLPAAAAVIISLGGGFAALHNIGTNAHSAPPTVNGRPPLTGIPFPAGPRAVYERGGTLWSAPQSGGAPAHALSPNGVQVAGWAVSPLAGASGGRFVAYLDARTGAVHIIRSDGQGDEVVGHAAAPSLGASFWGSPTGLAIGQGLTWSPDGSHLAYLAVDGSGNLALHVVTPGDAGDHTIPMPSGALTSSVRQLAWLGGAGSATLTWATSDGGAITGLYAVDVTSGVVRHLSPDGARLTAAAFSAETNTWLAAEGTALSTVSASAAGGATPWTAAGTAPAAVTAIVWAPKGSEAALAGNGQIMLWSASAGVLGSQPAGAALPAWSPDGSRLAYVGHDNVIVAKASATGLTTTATIAAPGAQAIAWAPDGQALAIVDSSGVVVTSSGTTHTLDSHTPDGGTPVEWSVVR